MLFAGESGDNFEGDWNLERDRSCEDSRELKGETRNLGFNLLSISCICCQYL